jgi:hypothetical protein
LNSRHLFIDRNERGISYSIDEIIAILKKTLVKQGGGGIHVSPGISAGQFGTTYLDEI